MLCTHFSTLTPPHLATVSPPHSPVVQCVETGTILPEPQVRRAFLQLLSAVHHCHTHGVAHRDLKLDNIMILGHESGRPEDLRVKLIDFGTSKHFGN